MVLTYIFESPDAFIKLAPVAYSSAFRQRYLDVVDIILIPQPFDRVGKTECQNILDCLFSQVMVYPVYLFFIKSF